jgi:sulfur carrier protein ThiS
MLRVTVEVVRAGRSTVRTVDVPTGSPVRVVVRAVGHAAEGCAVLIGDRPVPMDLALLEPTRLTVIPTFSGG